MGDYISHFKQNGIEAVGFDGDAQNGSDNSSNSQNDDRFYGAPHYAGDQSQRYTAGFGDSEFTNLFSH